MAYVNVPKDLSGVKPKVLFNLTARQLICLIPTVILGLVLYFVSRDVLGTTFAATVMVMFMLPGFLMALYERDGLHLEQVILNILRVKYLYPHQRPYTVDRSGTKVVPPVERRTWKK